jgi:hypothetical protein
LDLAQFYVVKRKAGLRYSSYCKKCNSASAKESDERDPVRKLMGRQRHNYKMRYGITPEHKLKMLKDQNNKCSICPTELTFTSAHIDHCHKTGQIRGILCSKCNHGIGLFKDSPNLLRLAIKYLLRVRG